MQSGVLWLRVISNFPKPSCQGFQPDSYGWGFRKVTLRDILDDKVPENWISDRVILTGYGASSLRNYK
jgi:CHASE2 domain-containing sensor protein